MITVMEAGAKLPKEIQVARDALLDWLAFGAVFAFIWAVIHCGVLFAVAGIRHRKVPVEQVWWVIVACGLAGSASAIAAWVLGCRRC